MKVTVENNGKRYICDPDHPHDLSIHVNGKDGPLAWYVDPIEVSPVRAGDYVGAIKEGSPVNFMNVSFNPHGNGTHTESLDHIADNGLSVCDIVPSRFLFVELITVQPTNVQQKTELSEEGDTIIMPEDLNCHFSGETEALIVRTLPNSIDKKNRVYSGTNPCYFHPETIQKIVDSGVDHLLIDLPSVDREDDGGKVLSHHCFWDYPNNPQQHRTITEMVFADNSIEDGLYLLNLQVAPFKMDASPSRPIIFPLQEI